MKVLVACEFSGIVRDAFTRKGHNAWSCDLLPTESPGNHIQGDVLEVMDETWDMIIAHPPCTHLAVSGSRWFKEKRESGVQQEAIDFFLKFVDHPCGKKVIENPICIMSSIYRKPDQIIQPWMFGHGETKATCLWLTGLPKLEATNIVDGRESRIHKLPPSEDRWKIRSRTYVGVAEAMADQYSLI